MYKQIRKFRRNAKAISPIISTLLLIAIAVVAALVTYAWVMGYIGFQTGKTGQAIQIQSESLSGTQAIYVENVGTGKVAFNDPCLYINGAAVTTGASSGTTYGPGSTATLPFTYTFTSGQSYTLKVTSVDGSFNQVTVTAP